MLVLGALLVRRSRKTKADPRKVRTALPFDVTRLFIAILAVGAVASLSACECDTPSGRASSGDSGADGRGCPDSGVGRGGCPDSGAERCSGSLARGI